eukprot:SAG11_NODE_3338_length_2515_cov_48.563328_1_plen_151_part_00
MSRFEHWGRSSLLAAFLLATITLLRSHNKCGGHVRAQRAVATSANDDAQVELYSAALSGTLCRPPAAEQAAAAAELSAVTIAQTRFGFESIFQPRSADAEADSPVAVAVAALLRGEATQVLTLAPRMEEPRDDDPEARALSLLQRQGARL